MHRVLSAVLVLAVTLPGQRGDAKGEVQPEVPQALRLPVAPPRAPAEQLAAFTLSDGFRLELVAAEPLVHDPVALAFDPLGRLWVAEMRGYMPDVDGRGELDRVGSIAVLEDRDGDGAMDRRTEFLTGLVLPRAVLPVRGGALVIEPPHLLFCEDRDGDLRCDARRVVAAGFDAGLLNPEHAGNGLLRGLDNWIHLANMPLRLRRSGDEFVTAPSFGGGQWGLCQDDEGRLYYDYNSDALRMDLVPGHYAVRNSAMGAAAGVNVQLVRDQSVFPTRPTPTVNRGYRKGQLRDDGRLATYTAACAPLVHRGTVFPAETGPQVLVCEPSANLIARYRLRPRDAAPSAELVERDRPFLECADERFRPVFLRDGPDGAIYVVDLYRGLIQHRNFVTTWLRKQVLERGLDQPIGLGRIWRLVRAGAPRTPVPRVAELDGPGLVAALQSPIGALRDLAQQVLVDRGGSDAVPALREALRTAGRPATRLHALWTLEGLQALAADDLRAGMRDADPALRAAALRCGEPLLRADREFAGAALALQGDQAARVRWQLAHTLTEVAEAGQVLRTSAGLLLAHPEDAILRGAVLSGMGRREAQLARALVAEPSFAADSPGRRHLLQSIGRAVARRGDAAALADLRGMLAGAPAWQAEALRDGLGRSAAVETRPDSEAVLAEVDPRRLERGQILYTTFCAACHQADAAGLDGLAPPLAESEWVAGPPARSIRILLHGVQGPIRVRGREFDLAMPGQPQLEDAQVADLLTFLRRSFGNRAGTVEPAEVAAIRAATRGRSVPWTAEELERHR
ncbi:MAG: c-type cytochrome [Planctomycetes bacterium]|nr:c-type cytochrome [Planctomycetota bacterium]